MKELGVDAFVWTNSGPLLSQACAHIHAVYKPLSTVWELCAAFSFVPARCYHRTKGQQCNPYVMSL